MIRRSRSRVRTALALAGAALLAVSACTTAQEEQARLNGEAAACPVEPDPSVRATVRIGWQAIPTGDLIVQERHLLESCLPSATIQWVQFDGGDDVVQAFGSGSIDLGISGSSAAVTAMSPPLELPVRLVWIADVIGASEALVSRDPSITKLEDLRGKKVAVTFGATRPSTSSRRARSSSRPSPRSWGCGRACRTMPRPRSPRTPTRPRSRWPRC